MFITSHNEFDRLYEAWKRSIGSGETTQRDMLIAREMSRLFDRPALSEIYQDMEEKDGE